MKRIKQFLGEQCRLRQSLDVFVVEKITAVTSIAAAANKSIREERDVLNQIHENKDQQDEHAKASIATAKMEEAVQ